LGQRARRRRQAAAQPPPQPQPRPSGYSRARERDEAARAALKPLAPGERPWPLIASAALAGALGLANFISFLAGVEVRGSKPSVVGIVAFSLVMFVAAWGIWDMRYWAVLGFQALLALILIAFFWFLLTASSIAAAAIAVAIIGVAGFLFWKLIRIMARLQMPRG